MKKDLYSFFDLFFFFYKTGGVWVIGCFELFLFSCEVFGFN